MWGVLKATPIPDPARGILGRAEQGDAGELLYQLEERGAQRRTRPDLEDVPGREEDGRRPLVVHVEVALNGALEGSRLGRELGGGGVAQQVGRLRTVGYDKRSTHRVATRGRS